MTDRFTIDFTTGPYTLLIMVQTFLLVTMLAIFQLLTYDAGKYSYLAVDIARLTRIDIIATLILYVYWVFSVIYNNYKKNRVKQNNVKPQ